MSRLSSPAPISRGASTSSTTTRSHGTSAFDAARSGSWHYYSPVSRRIRETAPGAEHNPITSPDSSPNFLPSERPVFDAANPSTWTNSTRLHTNTSRPRAVRAITAPSTIRSVRQTVPAEPQSVEEWHTYLANSRAQERGEILLDVLRVLRQDHGYDGSGHATPRAGSPTATQSISSSLDDPDFGDTAPYWNALYAGPRRTSQHDQTFRYVRQSTSLSRPAMPRQPTHLNQPGLVPDFRTHRRAASVASTGSDVTLPEYTVHIEGQNPVLPHYRSRNSFEVEV